MSHIKTDQVTEEDDALQRKLFQGHSEGFLRFGTNGCILPRMYANHADELHHMPLRTDDIWVSSFPRSGTTWVQELVWLLMNNFDYETASKVYLTDRYCFVEFFCLFNEQLPSIQKLNLNSKTLEQFQTPGYILAARIPSPRLLKTHLPLSLLPATLLDTCKVVYVARDPRDVAVSFFHHNRRFKAHDFVGDFKTYWDIFYRDLVLWSPFWTHLKQAWNQRSHPNMLFIFYNDLLKDLSSSIRRVSTFLNKECSEEQLRTLCNHLDFKNFKNNASVNFEGFDAPILVNSGAESFIRKGKSGGWREYFDAEMAAQAQRWMQRHLADTDLTFPDT